MIQTKISIKPKHFFIIKKILNNHLSKDTSVWIFGSRVLGKPKAFSDLDIALENKNNQPISLKTISKIQADFIDSDLPWNVDVIDYFLTSGVFRENIDSCKIELKN